MSIRVLLIVSALLIVAGGVSIVAAVMGNPIRIGRTRFPGPESSVERAVIGVIGAVCLAAIVPVFIIGAARDGNALATVPLASDAIGTPELVVAATDPPSPTATPEPPAGPSTAPPVPGKPTVTSIVVSGGPANGCSRPFTGTVHVSNGPVTVRYRIYVDGVVVGVANRTRTVNGTGAMSLDSITVAAAHSGAIKVRYDILGPNPILLTGSSTWTAPAQCQPPGPTTPVTSTTTGPTPTTTTPPPPPPSPSVTASGLSVTNPPSGSQPCEGASVGLGATLSVADAPGGLDVNYHFTVAGIDGGSNTVHVDTSAPISGAVTLTGVAPNSVQVALTISASGATASSPLHFLFDLTCTAS